VQLLIIGSKGFIGTHAELYFTQRGYKVYGCDVIVDYGKKNYAVIDATTADFHALFQDIQFDICLNCSGAASVPDSLKNPLRDFNLNVLNVFRILDAIRQYQPQCKFINLSSAAVYGNPQALPIQEKNNLAPVSPYGMHKLQAEQICAEFHQIFGLKTCSLRVFSAFGEGLKKQLFWDLYQKMKNKEVVELFGTGKETRDFIYIQDLLFAIECVIENAPLEHPLILNVANGIEISIAAAAHLFASLFDRFKTVTFNNQVKIGDPLNWRADITQLKNLGYYPQVTLEAGLDKYYQWVKTI
jgi:dTDP-glucose 4,6-dehydratase/UDP-glucose 4-epimerase